MAFVCMSCACAPPGLSRALDMPDGQAENEAIVHSGGFLPVYGHIQPAELPPLPVPGRSKY